MKIFLSGSTSFLGSKFIEQYSPEFEIFGFSKNDPINSIDMLDQKVLKDAFEKFDPDVIIHLAAVVENDAEKVREPNIQGTQNLVDLAKIKNIPFIYMSSESVYGGKEYEGNYSEEDEYKPRSVYGETKVEAEKIIKESGLNYLILRGHRFVGVNHRYNKPKQFPDTLKSLQNGEEVHLDSKKLFKPSLINHISEVIIHYLTRDADKKLVFNIGVDKATTYYDFITDVAKIIGLDISLIKPDGEEVGWPENSTLDVSRLEKNGYPVCRYEEMLELISNEYKN